MQRFIGLGQGNCEKGVVDREKGVGGDGREASVRKKKKNDGVVVMKWKSMWDERMRRQRWTMRKRKDGDMDGNFCSGWGAQVKTLDALWFLGMWRYCHFCDIVVTKASWWCHGDMIGSWLQTIGLLGHACSLLCAPLTHTDGRKKVTDVSSGKRNPSDRFQTLWSICTFTN